MKVVFESLVMSDPITIDNRLTNYSPTSNTSGTTDSDFLPTSLASEELKLALNKVRNLNQNFFIVTV